ncbi:MAG: asparagine synthase (glutamine-hydrolyzing) [Planctomycetota bacterium]|jgi:asparagine synthase (glutamine-hydrolysing)
MCGIVGEVQRGGGVQAERLERLADLLRHRGPDEAGAFVAADGRWGVAHRRLVILDPEGGRQPFRAPARGLTLVFNGEIYDEERLRRETDWPFRTRSDTEVLLALYAVHGVGFLRHLRGEFAFALVDEPRRKLLLVRDRFGLKPLFYTRVPQGLLFASEMRALLADARVARDPDPDGFAAALLGTEAPGSTPLRGIHQVPPAHYVAVDLDTAETSVHRYWDAWTDRRREVPAAYEDQVRLVREEVDEAIQLRLRADVPVGVFLSGGLDSSLVTARLASHFARVEAFVVALDDLPDHDERPYARALRERYPNVHLHDVRMSNEALLRSLPETVWHLERPFGNLHIAAKLRLARFARRHVGCVLNGDGGDEAFCGYATFLVQNDWERARARGDPRGGVRAFRAKYGRGPHNMHFDGGELDQRRGFDRFDRLFGFRPAEIVLAAHRLLRLRRLLHGPYREARPFEALARVVAPDLPDGDAGEVSKLHYLHLRVFGPGYVATLADRTEYAASLEARPPLFDHRVVALSMGLPVASKLRGDREKAVLSDAYRSILVPSIAQREKQPFLLRPFALSSPVGRELIATYLDRRAVRDAGILSPGRVMALRLGRRLRPRSNFVNRALTTALTIQIWHEQFVRGRGLVPLRA